MKKEIEYEAIVNNYRKQVDEIGKVKLPTKRAVKFRKMAATSLLAGGVFILASAKVVNNARIHILGERSIYDEYPVSEIMSDLKVSFRDDTTAGLVVAMNGKQVSFEHFINTMKDGMRMHYPDITDAEIKIALENAIPASLDNYFDVNDNDIDKTIEAAYYRMKEEQAREGLSK